MLESIFSRLQNYRRITVVATATTGPQVIERYQVHRPDVLLTDFKMPGVSGADLVRRIREFDPGARVVILTAYDDRALIEAGVKAGAVGYLVTSVSGGELLAQVRAAATGSRAFGPEAVDALVAGFRRGSDDSATLSRRELDVLRLLVNGMTNAEIAGQLNISTETVKSHVSRVYDKLKVGDRASAVRAAIALGLVPVDDQ